MTTTEPEPELARPPLTPGQRRVLLAVVRLTGERGYAPSIRDLMLELGIVSTNGVACHLRELARKGYVECDRFTARGVVVPELKAAVASAAAEYLAGL